MRAAVAVAAGVVCAASVANAQSLLQATDLRHLGAFMAPAGDDWTWGGHALADLPGGDPSGPADGFPGSLYVAAHAQLDLVGEMTIPVPVITDDVEALPAAAVLQAPTDITRGLLQGSVCASCATCDKDKYGVCTNVDVGGLAYLAGVDRVAWNVYDWYNVGDGGEDLVSLGWSTREPWNLQPYAHHFPETEIFDPDCGILDAATADRDRDLIYVAEQTGDPDGTTVIHVWRVIGGLFADDFESGGTGAWSSMAP